MNNSLRFWRKQRGVSQMSLARQIEVEQPMISWFESGDKEPTKETWEKIANVLNLPLDVLFAPPPISFGSANDVMMQRVTSVPSVPGEENGKTKKARRPEGFGRVNFLTPSQARVKVQLRKTIKVSEDEWDGVEVYVELPCEDDREAIIEAKAEAVRYCQDFVDEEINRIVQEYVVKFNEEKVGRIEDSEVTSVLENLS